MTTHARIASTWSTVDQIYARVGGSWKEVAEGYTKIAGSWKQFFASNVPLTVEYLVVAGGGGTTFGLGGGGGAGGYRSNVAGESSGGGASAEAGMTLTPNAVYTVTVGAGGAGETSNNQNYGGQGSDSVFHSITSLGGGRGVGQSINFPNNPPGQPGGSGSGGVRNNNNPGAGTTGQGFSGGFGSNSANGYGGGGGGGAGSAGSNGSGSAGGNGGSGVTSSITGTAVARAGGGGGAVGSGTLGVGTAGGGNGGADGPVQTDATAGAANTGGGGGGGRDFGGRAGGSGVVILRYPSQYAINASAGLTTSTITSGSKKVTTITQGTGSVSFTKAITFAVDYLVIAGGGSGGYDRGSGGGAGGYRTNVSGATSGGGASAEAALSLATGTNYAVTIGAGGATQTGYSQNNFGADSIFGSITSIGGGAGQTGSGGTGRSGGSGSGGGSGPGASAGGAGTTGQGFAGGAAGASTGGSGGGGGAGAVGDAGGVANGVGGAGGTGVSSSITGSAVTRAGGGGGGAAMDFGAPRSGGAGGNGGGGAGATGNGVSGTAGTANTGGGGGGGANVPQGNGGAGGSGLVVLRYPTTVVMNATPGLSHRTITSGNFNITSFTAGTGTVNFVETPVSDYELIQTVYLTSNQTSVTFDVSGLGNMYQHLQVRATMRSTYGSYPVFDMGMRFNEDSGANYSWHQLFGLGSGAARSEGMVNASSMRCGVGAANSLNASIFGATVIDVLDPFETTKNKTIRSLDGTAGVVTDGNYVMLHSGNWRSTTAVTSITLIDQYGGNFVANSSFSLYGIRG